MAEEKNVRPSQGPWSVSTVKIMDVLLAKSSMIQDTYGREMALADLKYSIFDEKHVYHTRQVLAELHIATEDIPKNLTTFRPHKIAMHLLIASVSTTLAIENETALKDVVLRIYKNPEFLHGMTPLYKKLDSERDVIKIKIQPLISKLIAGENVQGGDFSEEEINAVKEAIKKIKANNVSKLGSHVPAFSDKDAITLLVVDNLYKIHAEKMLTTIIDTFVKDFGTREKIDLIKPVNPTDMMVLMVTGGQASGKGTSVARVKDMLEHNKGIPWKQIVKINTDSYKPIILEPLPIKADVYSQLAQEEASLVHLAVQKRIDAMASAGNGVHHIFVDQVFVGKDKIELATKRNGSALITMVSTDVADAIERSYKRGETEGRFENTQGILGCHKNMTGQSMEVLSKFVGQNVFVQLVDNNVKKGESPIPVMDIDLKSKTVVIHNIELLERFMKKILINTNATSKADLYEKGQITIDAYLKPLVEGGVKVQLPGQSLSASASVDATSTAKNPTATSSHTPQL